MQSLWNKSGLKYFVKFILPNYEVYIIIWLFSHVELQVAHKIKSFGLPNVQILLRSTKTFAPKNQLTHHFFFTSLTPFLPFLFLCLHCQKLGNMWKKKEKQSE